MTKKKKNFIDKLAGQLRQEYNVKVNIISNITLNDINDCIKKSISIKEITLIKRNSDTEYLFRPDDKIVMIIYNGTGSFLNNDNYNVKTIFERDSDTSCKICLNEFKNSEDIRFCSWCSKSFCVKCQIKLMIDTLKLEKFCMICPYCRYEHKLHTLSLDEFINSLVYRLSYEPCLTDDDCEELLDYLSTFITSE